MCGIAGLLRLGEKPVSKDEVQSMCDAMVHRGPNDAGYYAASEVVLGMRRLSIIDLETGHQPVHNEDQSVWVVFNGEIYNFKHLRADLELQGHRFYTDTDTEVIVHLYEQYGEACVEKMRGMFAFAVWDANRKKLLLARDRLGIKPLFYSVTGGRLAFGSELKVLLQLPEISRQLSWAAVSHLFSAMCTPATQSIVEGVQKLKPGHLLIASAEGGIQIREYWDVDFAPDYGKSEQFFIERLRGLLEESVRLRLIADVPLGAFLSGGVDSSSVVATMAKISAGPVKTFSIGFTDPDYNELDYARQVAEKFGTEHHELVIEPNVLDVIDDIAWYLDEPFGDSSAIPTYMVSKLASDSVTVVLSGDGGDELFAGYDRYLVERRERKYETIPAPVRKAAGLVGQAMKQGMKGRNFLRHLALDGAARYLDANMLIRECDRASLFAPDAFREIQNHDPRAASLALLQKGKGHWLSSLQYSDIKSYLPNDILTKVDRMSMAHSIEARVPLLDHKLVEFAATIPPELKMKGNTTKYIFKRAMEGLLPNEILYRPKRGFAVPLSRWFRGRLGPFVRDLLLSRTSIERGIFRKSYIERLIEMNDQGRAMDLQLWTLITFELWCRRFIDESAFRRAVPASARGNIRPRVERARAHEAGGTPVNCS
ncbi:MAG: asparagine synthase (glutamine-hydrolyzing) [Acidobacteria bacterium 13_1_40CM_2_56_5]|nr:MAG: asparagine synthase (glutamine-hydrolyzing) [Acidobacteria bacterium 13_1_40CM_2_56_5]